MMFRKLKDNKKAYNFVSYIVVAAMAILLAFTYQIFIVCNNFAPAGLNGIATMVQYKTGFSIGYMSLIINVPLCVFAFFFIDKSFAKKTLVFCVTYSLFFRFLQIIDFNSFQYNSNGHDTVYPAILSGIISGMVYGVCFSFNSSTGGMDIIAKSINKSKPHYDFFYITFALNALVAIASFFVYAKPGENGEYTYNYTPVCLCLIYCFLSTFVGDFMIKGAKKALKFTIITTHEKEIVKEISEKTKHSVTKISAIGSYSNCEQSVLICIINRYQISELKEILNKYDSTFAFSETANEVYGNFKHIK